MVQMEVEATPDCGFSKRQPPGTDTRSCLEISPKAKQPRLLQLMSKCNAIIIKNTRETQITY